MRIIYLYNVTAVCFHLDNIFFLSQIFSAKWTMRMAEKLFLFDVSLSVCASARSEPLNQTSGQHYGIA